MTQAAFEPIPAHMHNLTPHLVCAGAAEAIEFYKKAFNAEEAFRLAAKDGKLIHAEVRIGDSAVMLMDEAPAWGVLGPNALKGSSVTIHVQVANADEVFAQAIAAGAAVKMPIADTFWGDRYGVLTDPFGHSWSVATHIRDVSHEEMQAAVAKMC